MTGRKGCTLNRVDTKPPKLWMVDGPYRATDQHCWHPNIGAKQIHHVEDADPFDRPVLGEADMVGTLRL
jgi:hypothetical protein